MRFTYGKIIDIGQDVALVELYYYKTITRKIPLKFFNDSEISINIDDTIAIFYIKRDLQIQHFATCLGNTTVEQFEKAPHLFCWAYVTEQLQIYWPKYLVDNKLFKTHSEVRRLIDQGGFYIDGKRQNEYTWKMEHGEYNLKLGKKRFIKIII